MASGSSLPAGGMWRPAPVKAAKISRGELSQYRSSVALSGGRRPFAIACAIRLACSSVGEDFGWARLIKIPPRITYNDSRELVSFLSEPAISTHKIRALGVRKWYLIGIRKHCNTYPNGIRIAHDQELQGEICRADPSGPHGPERFPGESREDSSPQTDYGGLRRLS